MSCQPFASQVQPKHLKVFLSVGFCLVLDFQGEIGGCGGLFFFFLNGSLVNKLKVQNSNRCL